MPWVIMSWALRLGFEIVDDSDEDSKCVDVPRTASDPIMGKLKIKKNTHNFLFSYYQITSR